MIETKAYPSSSSAAVYTVQRDSETSVTSCDCPGWRFQRPGKPRGCKHTKDLAGAGRVAAENAPAVKPMLASAMKDDQSLDDFTTPEWVLEEKMDGHRMLVVIAEPGVVTAWSRPGADRPAAQRALPPALTAALSLLPSGIYDGELLVPGGTSSDVTRLDRAEDLVIVLFDVIESRGQSLVDRTLTERRVVLERLAPRVVPIFTGNSFPVMLSTQAPVSLAAVQAIWAAGGEGAILKRLDSTYRSGWRTPHWVKVKSIGSAEFEITGFVEGKNGPRSVLALRHDDGRETTVKVLGNEMLAHVNAHPEAYLGKRCAVSFMGMTTGNRRWRHVNWDHLL